MRYLGTVGKVSANRFVKCTNLGQALVDHVSQSCRLSDVTRDQADETSLSAVL